MGSGYSLSLLATTKPLTENKSSIEEVNDLVERQHRGPSTVYTQCHNVDADAKYIMDINCWHTN